MYKNFLLLTLCFLLFLSKNNAQQVNRLEVGLIVDGVEKNNPFAGGLNSPQLSEVDLNNDGVMDLHFFDKAGDVHLTFLNNGSTTGNAYTFAPEYAANFPDIQHWALMRDYNGDGVMDIFAYSDKPGVHGVSVYKGSYSNNEITFERVTIYQREDNLLNIKMINSMGNIFYPQIQVTNEDLPAIDDIDGDGDLDILTFLVGGPVVYFYKNLSVEKGYGLDSLTFERVDVCWGNFKEGGLDAEIFLSDTPGECANLWDPTVETRHAGSTLLSLDLDNDQDKELILGDLTGTQLVQLTNGGTPEDAFMDGIDTNFPSYDVSVNMDIFLAAFYLDLDNDGKKDLMVAPNNARSSEDDHNIWFYKNIESNETPIFDFQRDDFIVNEMFDMGTGANPTFVDYNADGLLDIVVGNISFYEPFGVKNSRLFLLENIGTLENPKFELVDNDYLSLNQYNSDSKYFNFSPTFGDLDNDGDLDCMVGEETGRLIYLENIAGANNPLQFDAPDLFYDSIDAGQGINPQIVDVNRDGLNDLLIGWRSTGRVIYMPNLGSTGNPDFQIDPFTAPNNPTFGDVDTRIYQSGDGSASPMLVDINGEYVLYCGTQHGRIEVYENIDGNLDGSFTLVDSTYGNIREGQITHPALADFNGNGKLDILIGNSRGGLGFFSTDTPVSTQTVVNQLKINVMPNPADDLIYIEIEGFQNEKSNLTIFNSVGKTVLEKNLSYSKNGVDVSRLPAGIYFCEIVVGEKRGVKKVVLK